MSSKKFNASTVKVILPFSDRYKVSVIDYKFNFVKIQLLVKSDITMTTKNKKIVRSIKD